MLSTDLRLRLQSIITACLGPGVSPASSMQQSDAPVCVFKLLLVVKALPFQDIEGEAVLGCSYVSCFAFPRSRPEKVLPLKLDGCKFCLHLYTHLSVSLLLLLLSMAPMSGLQKGPFFYLHFIHLAPEYTSDLLPKNQFTPIANSGGKRQ